jgi:hypothetical protein
MTQTTIKIRIKSPQLPELESEPGPDPWVTPARDPQHRPRGERQLRTVAIVAILGVLALVLTGVAYIGMGGRNPRPVAAVDAAQPPAEAPPAKQSSLQLIDRSTGPETPARSPEAGTPVGTSDTGEQPGPVAQLETTPQEMPASAVPQQAVAGENAVVADTGQPAQSTPETTTAEPAPAPGDTPVADEPPDELALASEPSTNAVETPATSSPPTPAPEIEALPASAADTLPATESVSGPDSGPVARAQFTTGISRREPIDHLGSRIPAQGDQARSVFYFTDIRGMAGHTITHRWVYEGQTRAKVRFRIGGERWRIYSSKVLPPGMTGRWEVVITDEDGRVLKTDGFVFGPGADGVS